MGLLGQRLDLYRSCAGKDHQPQRVAPAAAKTPASRSAPSHFSCQHQLPEARHPACAPAHFPAASRSDQVQRRPRLRSANEPLPQHIGRLSRSAQSKPLPARALVRSRHAQLPALELGGREGCLMTLTAGRQRPDLQTTCAGARRRSNADVLLLKLVRCFVSLSLCLSLSLSLSLSLRSAIAACC